MGAFMQTIAILALAAITSFSVGARAETVSKDFDAAMVKNVEIKNGAGDIKITASTAKITNVSAEKIEWSDACTLTIEQRQNTIYVETKKTRMFGGGSCQTKITMSVPKTVSVDVDNGSGDVQVTGTQGPIAFDLGSGSLVATGEISTLSGSAGSGDIKAKGLSGTAEVKTGSGDINLQYVKLPAMGEINLKTGSGDSEITLPKNARILTDYMSGSGKMYNELGDTRNAPFKIYAKSGSGDLSIKRAD